MNIKKISFISMFLALSVVGASIKIPVPVTSVHLDMVPALLAGAILGGLPAAFIALFGHLISAYIGGMPLGPFHFVIAVEMALLVWMFAVLYQKGKIMFSSILFIFGNTIVAPLPFLFIMGSGFYVGVIPSLLIGSVFNVVIALLVAPRIVPILSRQLFKEEL